MPGPPPQCGLGMRPNRPHQGFCQRGFAGVEALGVVTIALITLALGLSNLAAPSLWHDELVHVFVAKSIAAGEGAHLPGGAFYPNALGYAHVLSVFIALLGDGEFAVRLPSVLCSVGTVLALYALARAWFGKRVAFMAALLLATSPWHVAWARQARMYEMQALCHVLMVAGVWKAMEARRARENWGWAMLALAAYTLGMLCSFHSVLFLGAPIVWAIWLWWRAPKSRKPAAFVVAAGLLGALTAALLYFNPNPVDQQAVFHGLGPEMSDPLRADRWYYVRWLADNLSLGFALVAAIGVAGMLWRKNRQGMLAALALLIPLLALTFLIGYRRPRFMYFAFPFYMLAASYGISLVALKVKGWWRKRNLPSLAMGGLFLARLGISFISLTQDSIETAAGNKNTLATSHPEWRAAGEWVRQHREGAAVLTTTYLAAAYYAGGADDWFPNRYLPGEVQESGKPGLGSLKELQSFVAGHPKGFFLSEKGRFENWAAHGDTCAEIAPELTWIQAHMRRVEKASTPDVNVYAWGELQ